MVQNDILPEGAVCFSLSGNPLYPIKDNPATARKKDSLLTISWSNFMMDSSDLENIIWYGRRLAYQSKFNEAIDVYSYGLTKFPDSPKLYRHRGHRYISIRKFDLALFDLDRAAELVAGLPIEIEPDGIPNTLNIPLSTLHFNIWYHKGLAHYLNRSYNDAEKAYETCLEYSTNNDLLVATSDWLYMTYMRSGQPEKAQKLLQKINPEMEVIENDAYLKRLFLYKELLNAEDLLDFNAINEDNAINLVTQGYGVANWYISQSDHQKAKVIMQQILETGYWSAFGYIAAEADLYNGF
jgi:tetratricopeptide (TPR) repeat protein